MTEHQDGVWTSWTEAIHEEEDRLRANGFSIVDPQEAAPGWADGYQVDVVGVRDLGGVVVKILVRGEQGAAEESRKLSQLVRRNPEWTFRVRVVDPPPDRPDPYDVNSLIGEARSALDHGLTVSAVLVGWAALEAALVTALDRRNFDHGTSSPAGLLRNAYAADLLTDRQMSSLDELAHLRNSLAHGRHGPIDVRSEAIEALLLRAELLLDDQYPAVAEVIDWFLARYEPPENSLPYDSAEGGYQWLGTGPHDAREVLSDEFPELRPMDLDEAIDILEQESSVWSKIS